MRGNGHGTLNKTLIYASGKAIVSTMFMTKIVLKRSYTKRQPNLRYNQSLKGTTLLSLPMVRLVPVRHILWKASSTMGQTRVGVLCQEVWKRSSTIFRCNRTKISLSWCVPVIFKFTMRLFQIYLKLSAQASKSGRIKRKVFLLRGCQSGPYVVLTRSTVCCREVHCLEPQPRPK